MTLTLPCVQYLFDVLYPRIFPEKCHGELPWSKHLQHPSNKRIVVRQAHVRLEGGVAEVGLRGHLRNVD